MSPTSSLLKYSSFGFCFVRAGKRVYSQAFDRTWDSGGKAPGPATPDQISVPAKQGTKRTDQAAENAAEAAGASSAAKEKITHNG